MIVIIKTVDMTQALASRAGNIGGIVISCREETRVVLNPLVFQAILSLIFLSSLFVGGFAILET